MDILNLMQRALDKTNDPDAIFALDRGITEIERLQEALKLVRDELDRRRKNVEETRKENNV